MHLRFGSAGSRRLSSCPVYSSCSNILSLESHKDLDVTFTSSLSWSPHVRNILCKAYRTLGMNYKSRLLNLKLLPITLFLEVQDILLFITLTQDILRTTFLSLILLCFWTPHLQRARFDPHFPLPSQLYPITSILTGLSEYGTPCLFLI